MNPFDITFGNWLTIAVMVFGFIAAWFKRDADVKMLKADGVRLSTESFSRFTLNESRYNQLADAIQTINQHGSTGAKREIDMLHAQLVSHEGRISAMDSIKSDLAKANANIEWMSFMMRERWGVSQAHTMARTE